MAGSVGIPVASDNKIPPHVRVQCGLQERPGVSERWKTRDMQAVGRLCYVARLHGVASGDPCSQMGARQA